MIKGKGQRLIPEELLKYLEAYKENHPDPAGGGGESSTLEDIVDSAGNKRFIEGNGTPATISGITSLYCKWSLSGTHLMLVFAGKISDGYGLPIGNICTFTVPKYISDKVVPIWETSGGLTKNTFIGANIAGGGPINLQVTLKKISDDLVMTLTEGITTLSQDKYFRIQFDLLIDADYS